MLTCRNVSLAWDDRVAVRDVSFEAARGDYLCVVGENGSGKSTLMKGLLGLIKPISGSIEYEGVTRTGIGYLPQQTVIQRDFPASVREVVLSGCLNRHGVLSFYTRRDRARADENLERLGIADLARKSCRDLSGGQRQRVLLARALCAAEGLLMLDEPVAGLDPVMASGMYALLERLNDDGLTLIVISHDLKGALRYGNKILHMRTKALFYGETGEYVRTDFYRRLEGLDKDGGDDAERAV
ncbi:MAG: ABC transporter ATP-binding protein [Synergistaceae bacterium]|jgi:zinc transport system ATP-binding protein|nr:ABC transporter ATP-binding protein [Synergistaceae bacterium]